MAGRHRAVAPNRPLTREVGRVGALLLLTTAPLVQVGTASAAGVSGPAQERRTQTDDFLGNRDDDRESSRDRDSDDDRRSGTGNASNRHGNSSRGSRDDAQGSDHRGRHRADDDAADDRDDADEDRGSDLIRAAGIDGDRPSRTSRNRSAESTDDVGSRRKSRSARESDDDQRVGRRVRERAGDAEDAITGRRARSKPESTSRAASESRWDRLAQCESKERWSANTGNGYRGGLQFSDSTWRAYGGGRYAPAAHQASREEQIEVASKVQREQGWSAWPACSRKLGYT